MSRASTQILTWASIRRGAQWWIGDILIRVLFKDRKQRSMTMSPLYPQAASCRLMVSSLVSITHRPSYLAACRTAPRLIRIKPPLVTFRYRLKRSEASKSMAQRAVAVGLG